MLGNSGPFPSLPLFCIGFPNFSRIFTTTLWKPPRDAEGAFWLSGPFLVGWLPLSPNSLGLTTMCLKVVWGFSILSHKRFPRLWLCKTYCSMWNGELVDDLSFLDNEFQPVESIFHGRDSGLCLAVALTPNTSSSLGCLPHLCLQTVATWCAWSLVCLHLLSQLPPQPGWTPCLAVALAQFLDLWAFINILNKVENN